MNPSLWLLAPALAALLLLLATLTRERRRNAHLLQENQILADKLASSRLHFRHLFNHAGDAIFLISPDSGTLLEVNRQGEELLGYSAEELRTLDPRSLFSASQFRRYRLMLHQTGRNDRAEKSRLTFRRKNGEQFTGEVHARLGDLGSARVIHGVVRDVTESLRIRRELERTNRDLQLVNRIAHHTAGQRDLDPMLAAILAETVASFAVDGGGIYRVRLSQPELELRVHQGIPAGLVSRLQGLALGEGLVGRVALNGQPRSTPDLGSDRRLHTTAVREDGWKGFQAVPLVSGERTLGVLFLFSRRARLFGRDEGRLLRAIGRQVGIALEGAELVEALHWQVRLTQASNRELEASRRQLRENLRQLQTLDRMKSHFLGLASHELRTPLTFVLSGSEFLLDAPTDSLPADSRRFLEAIHAGGQRLRQIVDDLLEMARLESRSIYLAREPVDVRGLLEDVLRRFQERALERGLALELVAPAAIEGLQGDRHHLFRSLERLVENALKFTAGGGRVTLSAERLPLQTLVANRDRITRFYPDFFERPAAAEFVDIRVSDSGIGISPEEQLLVFDKFYESGDIAGHSSSPTRFGGKGVGLGLAIVKGVMEIHGGLVWVESPFPAGSAASEGGGSCFHLLLPLAAPVRA